MRSIMAFIVLAMASWLSACTTSSVGSAVGAVSGLATSAATANPAVGYAVGIGVQAATDASIKAVLRHWTTQQQDLIAQLAGELPLGQRRAWAIHRTIPYGREKGQLEVIRDIPNALAFCRELLFTVEEKEQTQAYTAVICKQQQQWKWASAEPAVPRWRGLH